MALHDTEAASNDTRSESAQTDPSNKYTQRTRASSPITSSSYHNVPVYPRRFHGPTASETSHDPNPSPVDVELKVQFTQILKKVPVQSQRAQALFWEQVRAALESHDEVPQPVLLDVPLGRHGGKEEPSAEEQQAWVEKFVKDQLELPKLFDDYLEKVGDWELARDDYTRYTQYLQQSKKRHNKSVRFDEETQVGEGFDEETPVLTVVDFQQAKSLEYTMRDIYQEVREMEQKCIDAHILDPARSRKEDFIIWCILDTDLHMERWAVSFLTAEVGDLDQPQFFSGDDMDGLSIDPNQDPDLEPPELPRPPSSPSQKHWTPPKPGFEKANFGPGDPSHFLPSPTVNESGIVSNIHPSQIPKPPVALPFAQNRITPSTVMAQHVLHLLKPPLDVTACQVIYEVSWELPAFFTSHYPTGSKLGSLLTVTGSNDDAYATTCEAYLSRWWGPLGLLLLHSIEDMLLNFRSGFSTAGQSTIGVSQNEEVRQKLESLSSQSESDSPPHAFEPYVSTATISVQGSLDNQTSLASAIMWLCSAIRFPRQGLDLSESLIAPISDDIYSAWPKLQVFLKPLQSTDRDGTQGSCYCWHKLFDKQVIASGFQIPERTFGHGLEISYQDMLLLSRSKGLARIHGGLLPEGFSTLLIPVEKTEEVGGSSIQWHLEMKLRQNPNDFQILTTEMLDQIWPKPWLKVPNEADYLHQRTFLGWTTKAAVIAGTSNDDNLGVELSGYDEIDAVVKKSTFGVGMTVGWSPFSISMNHTTTPSLVASSVEKKDIEDTYSALQGAITSHSVIYDTDAEIGWLLQHTCIILFMCHVILKHRKEEVDYRTCPAYPEPLPGKDAGFTAFEAIKASLNWTIPNEKAFSKTSMKPQKFSSLVQAILMNFRQSESLLRQSRVERAQCGKGAPDYIIGVELIDVALPQYGFIVKEAAISQPWAHFTTKQLPLVFFCKNLDQPIVSWGSEPICANWRTVPPKQKYLVAMGNSVSRALKSAKICWKPRDKTSLFTKHGAGAIPKDCSHVQNLSINRSSGPPDVKGMEMIQDWEAYIFGSGQKIVKPQPLAPGKKYLGIGSLLRAYPNQNSQKAESGSLVSTPQSSRLSPYTHNNRPKSFLGNMPPSILAPRSSLSNSATSGGSFHLASSSRGSFTSPDFQESNDSRVEDEEEDDEDGGDEEVEDEEEGDEDGGDEEVKEKDNGEEVLKQPVQHREPSVRYSSIIQFPQSNFNRTSSDSDTGCANSRSHTRPMINIPNLPHASPRSPGLRHKKKSMNLTERSRPKREATFAGSMTTHSSESRMKKDSARLLHYTRNSTQQHSQNILSNGDVEIDDDERLESSIGKDNGKQKEETIRPLVSPIPFSLQTQREITEPIRESHQDEQKQSMAPSSNENLSKLRERSSSRRRRLATTERVSDSPRGESEMQQRPRKKGHKHRQSGKGKQDK